MEQDYLILKRASASRPSGVLHDGFAVRERGSTIRLCSPHSLQHLLDLAFGLRERLCIAGAQHHIRVGAVLWIEERIALDRDPRIGFGNLAKLYADVALARIRAYGLREHANADLKLRRHLIEHRLHDRGWSSTPNQRRASALRTADRFIGAGGGLKKKKVPIDRARGRLGFVTYYVFPIGCRMKQYACKSLKFHRDNAKNLSLFAPENAISAKENGRIGGVDSACSRRFRRASKIRCRTRDGGHHRNHARGKTRAP